MTDSSQRMARERLSWIEDLRIGILGAVGEDVVSPQFQAFPTVDPLKFLVKITLRRPLAKKTREPLRAYFRCQAEKHGCEAPIIRITDQWIQAEVLTVHRTWSRDAHGQFHKGGRRFVGGSG